MALDHIRYDLLAQEALRGLVRNVLRDAAKNGLPGEHHFYITFDTCAEGVRLSPRILAQYPQEMTIVLQHQFWDLVVTEDGFEVGLAFGGIAERLVVPLAAVKGFFDPSVQFGLKFEDIAETVNEKDAAGKEQGTEQDNQSPRKRRRAGHAPADPKAARRTSALASVPVAPDPTSTGEPDKPSGGGEIVRLDRFRKK
jgi:uncharacterized protein